MKKNKIFKIFTILMIILSIFIILSQSVSALNFNIDEQFENRLDKGNSTETLAGIIATVINILQVVGTGFAILMIVIIGVKWMYESPAGKAQISKSVRYYVLGAILIFAATGLLQIVKTICINNIQNA